MITTVETKRAKETVFTVGSDNPTETILIVGSCRANACLNYLNRYNESHGQPFRIHFVDPNDFHWNERDELVDLEEAILRCESNQRILEVLRNTTIFLHEYYRYFGMFNTDKVAFKNIYDFGLNPKIDICFPNFHDRFVLFQELVNVDEGFRDMARRQGGNLSIGTITDMRRSGLRALEKFYDICSMSSFPEMAEHFAANWTKKRFFWTGNHVSRFFTLYIFERMNERFLKLNLDREFWAGAETEDLFAKPCTPVTQFDRDAYGITWDDPTEALKI